jgi:hypothetical protein
MTRRFALATGAALAALTSLGATSAHALDDGGSNGPVYSETRNPKPQTTPGGIVSVTSSSGVILWSSTEYPNGQTKLYCHAPDGGVRSCK